MFMYAEEYKNLFLLALISAPALAAVFAGLVFYLKNKATCDAVVSKFEEVRCEIFNTKEYTELKDQLKIVHQENVELKKKINELLTTIDHIKREE